MKKALRIVKKFVLFFIAIILIIGITYAIKPDFVTQKLTALVAPTIQITDAYEDKIVVEDPKVYELLQIALSLTKKYQEDSNLIDKQTEYYKNVETHFLKFQDHPFIEKLNVLLDKDGAYSIQTIALRLQGLNFSINEKNMLSGNDYLNINPLITYVYSDKTFLIENHLDMVNDFAQKTQFYQFYYANKNTYENAIENYNKLCSFSDMQQWLEQKFTSKYQSYRIIFSPLTGGFHNTMSFKDVNKNKEQTLMFVNAPYKSKDSLSTKEFEIKSSKMARIVFTEIDHNYVNPLTDKFLEELETSMTDYKKWNSQKKNDYATKYKTFNEYMTWGVFSLYALDTYSDDNISEIIKIQSDFITKRRKFHRFTDFNKELIHQYVKLGKPKIEKLYPIMFKWMKENE